MGVDDVRTRVFNWRLQAERMMADQGKPAMSDEAVKTFVERFLPSYDAYLPELYKAARAGGVDGK